MNIIEYCKQKRNKQRTKWDTRTKRYAKDRTPLDKIRNEVYQEIRYNHRDCLMHLVKHNPIVQWREREFSFSENALRDAMAAEGADLTLFEMKVKRQRLKEGEKIDLSKHYNYRYSICPNDSWIDEFAKQCTDVETVKLTYGQATMVIKRYSIQGVPFCYYTLNPCEQLVGESMILNETDFSMLNIGTLLMEMAAEMEMRQKELAYHSKKLRLRLMASTVMDDVINFTLWDNTTLSQKIDEYISNGYNTEKIINLALRPWKSAINKYFDLALLRMANESCLRFQKLSHDNPAKEIEKYLKEANLELCDVNLSGDTHSIIISYQNYQCFAQISSTNNICLIPTTCCCSETIKLPSTTPLEIFALFIKQMPTINKPANDYVDKVRQLYTQKLRERAK
ncbi:MAG: hypothetical protein J6C15_05960 [Bacteroidaceae bacterium]|nr:hypothetical protein [Bacteroidaceae bacterium]